MTDEELAYTAWRYSPFKIESTIRRRNIDAPAIGEKHVQPGEEQLQQLLNTWCQELLPIVQHWDLKVDSIPVLLKRGRHLSATVEGNEDSPRIVIGKNLVTALSNCNRNLFNFGWKMFLENDPILPASNAFMHDLMALVFAMEPPLPPLKALAERLTKPGYDDYRSDYEARARERLERDGAAFLTQLTPAGTERAETIEGLGNLAANLNSATVQFQLLECQIKFLILHELAHIALGHLCCETSEDGELEADRLAAEVYLATSAEHRQSGSLVVDSPALITLFSTIGFIEDLIRLIDQSILHGIPDAMRDAFHPIARSHPCVRQRAALATEALYQDGSAQLVAFMNECALGEIKVQFRKGIINTRVFKWFVRIRGLEMQAGYAVRRAGTEPGAGSIADIIKIERSWDSIDLQWGPLIDDIFPDDWHDSVVQPKIGGTT